MAPSFWQSDPLPPRPSLQGDARAEVCIVGAGIGGLATAWHLLDRGILPFVVEAQRVAGGASGRNGGFFIAGAAPMYHRTRDLWGAHRARRIHAATLAAQDEMEAVTEEIGATSHLRRTGMLRLAVDPDESQDVREHAAALEQDALPGELVHEDALPPALRRPGRLGLLSPRDGVVHPVRWLRALADACERRGARIFEGSRVDVDASTAEGVVLKGRGGSVRAERAVVAVDGALGSLVPAAAAVRCRRLNMLATAAEPAARLPFPVYARYGQEYAQQLPGGEVTLGGFSDLDGQASWTQREEVNPVVQARLEAYLREELDVRARVTHRWAGVVGYSEDPLPRCGAVPGTDDRLYALGGYNGTGFVQAWVAAGIVADLLASGASSRTGLYAPLDAG